MNWGLMPTIASEFPTVRFRMKPAARRTARRMRDVTSVPVCAAAVTVRAWEFVSAMMLFSLADSVF